jgi:hypothetical protein
MPTLSSGNPLQSVVDGYLGIEQLDIDWQKYPADRSQWLLHVTDGTGVSDVSRWVGFFRG